MGGSTRAGAAAPQVSRGVFAAAGPYDDGREVRLEEVPEWPAPRLMARRPAGPRGAGGPRGRSAGVAGGGGRARAARPARRGRGRTSSRGQHGASPGRSGELRDELRVERLDPERVRIARWIMRPNRGWELQEAPVLLPPARFVQALQAAAANGVLASDHGG